MDYFPSFGAPAVLEPLIPFSNNNHNLSEIRLQNCGLDKEGCRLLSLAIRAGAESLKRFTIYNEPEHGDIGADIVDIIDALCHSRQLECLSLRPKGVCDRNLQVGSPS